jgi:hypothetical protein
MSQLRALLILPDVIGEHSSVAAIVIALEPIKEFPLSIDVFVPCKHDYPRAV